MIGPDLNFTRCQPYGVVAKINPFNHPFRFCAEKAAAALAAGNTVVVKSLEQAPLSSLRFAEVCEGVFPPGVVNVVTGSGETGSAMVRHPSSNESVLWARWRPSCRNASSIAS